MNSQVLASCTNCWFNGLQYGSIGLYLGYCSEHRLVLRLPEETTCARHIRKDLLLRSAAVCQRQHQTRYQLTDGVQRLSDLAPVTNGEYVAASSEFIRDDRVGEAVADYGEYDTKIESLSQLRAINTLRAEFAMLSLARAYTDRCVKRMGSWTSGIHIFWWTRRKLIDGSIPDVQPTDFRYSTSSCLERQRELARWSLLMFRLVFVSDLGVHAAASDPEVGALEFIAEKAAAETETPSLRKLTRWIKASGARLLENAMPEQKYRNICESLRTP